MGKMENSHRSEEVKGFTLYKRDQISNMVGQSRDGEKILGKI